MTGLLVAKLFAVTERGIPLNVDFDGDLTNEPWPAALALSDRARDDLVGVISEEKLGLDRGTADPGPEDFGRGIALPSRDIGRLLDASSSMCCRARFTGEGGLADAGAFGFETDDSIDA